VGGFLVDLGAAFSSPQRTTKTIASLPLISWRKTLSIRPSSSSGCSREGVFIPWLARAERLLRPRAVLLVLPPMEYLVGLVCLLLAVVLVLPIPLGNMLPALAISMLALGILERDGFWILAGLAVAAVSAAVVSGVVFAAFKAAVYFVTKVLP
jgi:hypothetical protein